MTKPTKSYEPAEQEGEAVIMERMNEALKRMMNTPPETHEEMVERRRGAAPSKRKRKGAQRPKLRLAHSHSKVACKND